MNDEFRRLESRRLIRKRKSSYISKGEQNIDAFEGKRKENKKKKEEQAKAQKKGMKTFGSVKSSSMTLGGLDLLPRVRVVHLPRASVSHRY